MTDQIQDIKNNVEAPTPGAGKSLKNFRGFSEVEALYRFVHENDMKRECVKALDQVKAFEKKSSSKKTRTRKAKAKKILQ